MNYSADIYGAAPYVPALLRELTDEAMPRLEGFCHDEMRAVAGRRGPSRRRVEKALRERTRELVSYNRARIKADIRANPDEYKRFVERTYGNPIAIWLLGWLLSYLLRKVLEHLYHAWLAWMIRRRIDDLFTEETP